MLTNQLWEYNTAAAAMGADGVFDFNWLPPGVYTIRNFADAALPVLLFNHTYNVEVGQEWRFVAHDEVGSHAGPLAGASGRWFDGNDARLTQSYWDRALGGSIWDNGASVWDLINSKRRGCRTASPVPSAGPFGWPPVSQVDPSVPIFGNPTTQSVRSNFAIIKGVLEDLAAQVGLGEPMPVANGGTGASTTPQGLINLGIAAYLSANGLALPVPVGGGLMGMMRG